VTKTTSITPDEPKSHLTPLLLNKEEWEESHNHIAPKEGGSWTKRILKEMLKKTILKCILVMINNCPLVGMVIALYDCISLNYLDEIVLLLL